jgi:hypothetical protein
MHLQGGLAGRRLDGDMTQINWSVWLLWIFGAVVVFVTSYLYLLLPVVVFAVGLASYLLWRMHPIPLFAGQDWALSKRGLDRRRTVASKPQCTDRPPVEMTAGQESAMWWLECFGG